jgi:hypothetical protein
MTALMYALLVVYVIIALLVYAITTTPPLFSPANAPPRNSVATGLMYGAGWPLIVVGLPVAYVGYAILNVFVGPSKEDIRKLNEQNAKFSAEQDARLKLEQAAIDATRAKEAEAAAREKAVAPALAITVTPVQPQSVVAK